MLVKGEGLECVHAGLADFGIDEGELEEFSWGEGEAENWGDAEGADGVPDADYFDGDAGGCENALGRDEVSYVVGELVLEGG